jgi:8-amino-7-oxononanoate synthase
VLAPKIVSDFLVNRARPFIFATAPSPLIAAVTRAALRISRERPRRRERLARLVGYAGRELKARCGLMSSHSHILPIIVGADRKAVALAKALQQRGFDVRAIRPPTVPEGTARLRLALTASLSEAMIADLFDAMADELRRLA